VSSFDDIQWNELPIVARRNGELSVWKAWKRSIAAFNDPQMWRDDSNFAQYFERQEDNQWGMAGYGIIVVDFDSKRVVSINDYSHPGSFFPPNPLLPSNEDPSRKALLALLAEPAQWSHVIFEVNQEKDLLDTVEQLAKIGKDEPVKIETVSMENIIPHGSTVEQALEAITLDERRRVKIDGTSRIFFGANYVPPGWTQQTDLGQEMPKCLLDVLHDFQRAGFPEPQWEGIEEKLTESYELPITPEDIEAYIDGYCDDVSELDPEELRELQNMQQMGRDFIALKEKWTTMPIAKRAPRP
jgi:hypothetical protein